MNTFIMRTVALSVLLIAIAGCKTEPKDIAEWKAQGNTGKLIGALNDSQQLIRIEAIAALTELNAHDAIEPLGALLTDPDTVIVHKSIAAMAAIGGPSIEPYMLQAISFKTEPARLTAATALGTCKSAKAVDPLIHALDDEFESVVTAAAVSLGQIGDAKAIDALTRKLTSSTYTIRFASITSLCQIGGDATTEGLASVMGDLSENIRDVAINGLITIGDPAVPYALEGLRSESEFTRPSAAAILKGTGHIPTQGADLVWYTLASIPEDPHAHLDPVRVKKLAGIEGATETLTEAMNNPDQKILEYALAALTQIGKPATEAVVAAAEQRAKPQAKEWFTGRSDWPGAPSWRIDLWGALTALNPHFEWNPRKADILSNRDEKARTLLSSKQFKPTPEYAPLLIAQTATQPDMGNANKNNNAALNKPLAEKKLMGLGPAIFNPVAAGLGEDDLSMVSSCARVLLNSDPKRARPLLLTAFKDRVEAGVDVSGSDFLTLITELNDPSIEPYLAKVRPDDARALQVFERSFPGTHVSIIVMPPKDQIPTAEPFRLKYLLNGKAKELKVVFRPNADGEWVPNPPFPDSLP